jgi:hypothetical protein
MCPSQIAKVFDDIELPLGVVRVRPEVKPGRRIATSEHKRVSREIAEARENRAGIEWDSTPDIS